MDCLNDTLEAIRRFCDERDWSPFHVPTQVAAALAVEAAELQETMLWQSESEVRTYLETEEGHHRASEEVADVLIYALLFCQSANIDPIHAIHSKLVSNAQKYPVESYRARRSGKA